MTIAELVAKITLKGGKETVATMKGLLQSTVATKAALLGAATALYKMSDAARQSAMYMDSYQLNTGLSITQLQTLSYKAAQAGVSMQELGGTIQKLQQLNANARLGYGWDPILTRFGLTPGQDPVTQLDRISNALKRLGASNPAEAHALASKVGLSDSMYYALMKMGTEQMNKQLILTNKEQQALVKLNQQWNKFWFYLKQVIIKIQALGANFQTGVVKVLIRATQGFYELFSRIYKAIEASDKLKYAVIALGVAFALAFAPELLLLSAVALALEDIFTYFEGGDSVTGEIINWIKQSQKLKDTWEGVKIVFELFKKLLLGIKTLWDETIYPMIDKIVNSKIFPLLSKALEFSVNPLGSGLELLGAAKREYGDWLTRPLIPSLPGPSSNTQNNTNTFYIDGAGNPKEVAQEVVSLQQSVSQANAQQHNLANGNKTGTYRNNPWRRVVGAST